MRAELTSKRKKNDGSLWRLTEADRWFFKRSLKAFPWIIVSGSLFGVVSALAARYVGESIGSAWQTYGIFAFALAWAGYFIANGPGWWRRLDELEKNVELTVMVFTGVALMCVIGFIWVVILATGRPLLVTSDAIAVCFLGINVFYFCALFALRFRIER